jgi:hypothetical protein
MASHPLGAEYFCIQELLWSPGRTRTNSDVNKLTRIAIEHLIKRGYPLREALHFIPTEKHAGTRVMSTVDEMESANVSKQHLDEVITILTLLQEVSP